MRQGKINITLPPLAFGGRSAKINDSITEAQTQLKSVITGLIECQSTSEQEVFQHQSALMSVNGMNMISTASTPLRLEINRTEDITLLIPFSGSGNMISDGRIIHWQAGVNALLLAKCAATLECTLSSLLILSIDAEKGEAISREMLEKRKKQETLLKLEGAKKLNLRVGRMSFDVAFRQLANLLDQFSLQPELLNQTGIESNLYRNLAILLQPESFIDALGSTPNHKYARRLLDRVCEYIKAHLNQHITIATLERVSNMSARNLHYAFLKRYNTTPMRWVRRERLILAQSKLMSAIPGNTVTSIALSCGFSKPAAFANYYFNEFGELPSAALSKSLKS